MNHDQSHTWYLRFMFLIGYKKRARIATTPN